MKLRIARVEINSRFGDFERYRKYAVQVRVGFFWWQTLGYCDCLGQAKIYAANLAKQDRGEVVLSVAKEPIS